MGFLVEVPSDEIEGQAKRMLVSEEELIENHSREMYLFLKKHIKYETKVPVKLNLLMDPNFQVEVKGKASRKGKEEAEGIPGI